MDEVTDTIQRNYEWKRQNLETKRAAEVKRIVDQVKVPGGQVLDVGCGGYMPAWLGVDAALDISPLSGELLKKEGWGGEFKVGSAEKIPWPDKSFELAVCSEVVEHMANIEEVRRTLAELRRVARTWLVTTPCASVWGVRDVWNTEPTHKLFFDLKTLSDLSEATEKHSWIIFEGRKIDSVKHAFLWGIR